MVVILVALLAPPTAISGQWAPKEVPGQEVFDRSALRLRHRLFRAEVVRGSESISVARIGLGTPPLGDLFSRSDEATLSFDEFRKDHKRGSWLTVLGGLELLGSLVARSQDSEDWAMALSISGVVIEGAGMIFRTRADEHLSQAIWWYNASLPKGSVR
jgi:hypothetical protein